MERFSFVFLVAGLGLFALAFVVSAWLPMLPVQDLDVRRVEDLASEPPLSSELELSSFSSSSFSRLRFRASSRFHFAE